MVFQVKGEAHAACTGHSGRNGSGREKDMCEGVMSYRQKTPFLLLETRFFGETLVPCRTYKALFSQSLWCACVGRTAGRRQLHPGKGKGACLKG